MRDLKAVGIPPQKYAPPLKTRYGKRCYFDGVGSSSFPFTLIRVRSMLTKF